MWTMKGRMTRTGRLTTSPGRAYGERFKAMGPCIILSIVCIIGIIISMVLNNISITAIVIVTNSSCIIAKVSLTTFH